MENFTLRSIRTYGREPFEIALLHGGPGAAGDLHPVGVELGRDFGVLELLQTNKSLWGQVDEVCRQLLSKPLLLPVTLVGHSWGAWLGLLVASIRPELVKRVVLIGAGAFERTYVEALMAVRLARLEARDPALKREATVLLGRIMAAEVEAAGVVHAGSGLAGRGQAGPEDEAAVAVDAGEGTVLGRFEALMRRADGFALEPALASDVSSFDLEIFRKVWEEAAAMRSNGTLLRHVEQVQCPVVALHGEFDPHPVEGVEVPLTGRLRDFRLLRLGQCGHVPWQEVHARDEFYAIMRSALRGELV